MQNYIHNFDRLTAMCAGVIPAVKYTRIYFSDVNTVHSAEIVMRFSRLTMYEKRKFVKSLTKYKMLDLIKKMDNITHKFMKYACRAGDFEAIKYARIELKQSWDNIKFKRIMN